MSKVFDENLPCPDDVQSSLHHRIADALFDACCRFDVPDSERRDMADAVIAELGLTRVTRSERVPIHRYVTDWSNDD